MGASTATTNAADLYPGQASVGSPADGVINVTVGDDVNQLTNVGKFFWVSASGMTLAVVTKDGTAVTLVPAVGVVYKVRLRQIKATGSTFNSGTVHVAY